MYKQFKLTKDYTIAFESFCAPMKEMLEVYKTGIRNWDSDSHYTYSIVIGRLRVMLYKDNHKLTGCA